MMAPGRRMHGLALVALLAPMAACSPLAHTVSNRAVRHVPPEKQLRLFDAENDVSIAMDERARMVEALEALDRAHSRARRPSTGKQPAGAGRAKQARIAYLAAAKRFLEARIRAENKVILVALAKFELAKAILVKKNNLDGAPDIRIPEFERQAAHESEASKRQLAQVAPLRERATKLRVEWETAQQAVATDSLGGAMGATNEEDPQWEIW